MNRKLRSGRGVLLVMGMALLGSCGLVLGQPGQDKGGTQRDTDAGIRLRLEATEKEVGLPIYPGARPHPESKADSPAANIGLWGKSFGFKLVVLKLESKEAPAIIAAFYQKQLAKYGKVLDCTHGEPKTDGQSASKTRETLTCDDTPETGAMVFKSGTKNKQHIVGIKPDGQGSVFQLVLIDTRGLDSGEHPL
jgi:hypothetical protein